MHARSIKLTWQFYHPRNLKRPLFVTGIIMASPQAPAQYDEKGKQTAACELVPVNSLIIITRVYPWKFHGLVNFLCSFRS